MNLEGQNSPRVNSLGGAHPTNATEEMAGWVEARNPTSSGYPPAVAGL